MPKQTLLCSFSCNKSPLFIDEVQYAPELFPYIKIQIDKNHNPGDFWLTGSQIFKLMEGVQESLAGRVALLHMPPLSQHEVYQPDCEAAPFTTDLAILSERQKKVPPADTVEIYERIFQGGMPALVGGRYSDRAHFYSDYIGTYLERDVRDISGTIDSLKFIGFITAGGRPCGADRQL